MEAFRKAGLDDGSGNLHDRRSVLVRLSPAGAKAIGEVTPLVRRVNEILFQHVTAKGLTTIVEFLNALSLNSEYAAVEVHRFEHDRNAHCRGA